MTTKETLHQWIEDLSDDEAEELLVQVESSEHLTDEEILSVEEGRAAIAKGDFITGEDLRAKYGF